MPWNTIIGTGREGWHFSQDGGRGDAPWTNKKKLPDALLINLALVLAYWTRYDLQLFRAVDPAFAVTYDVYLPFVAVFTLLLLLVYWQHGIYRLRRKISWFDEVYAIINGTATGTIIMIVFIFIYSPAFYSRAIFIYAGIFVVSLLALSRYLKTMLLRQMRRRGIGTEQVLIVGAGVGLAVMRAVRANPEYGFTIIGFLDDHPIKGETDIGRFRAFRPSTRSSGAGGSR